VDFGFWILDCRTGSAIADWFFPDIPNPESSFDSVELRRMVFHSVPPAYAQRSCRGLWHVDSSRSRYVSLAGYEGPRGPWLRRAGGGLAVFAGGDAGEGHQCRQRNAGRVAANSSLTVR